MSTGIDVPQDSSDPSRDFVGYGRVIPSAEWPDGARLALSFVINYEEGAEYSVPDGDGHSESHGVTYDFPPQVRNLRIESQYEYGSRAGVWRLLRIFDKFNVRVTFHASARAIERNPEVGELIRARNHEACAHGWRWDEQWQLPVDEQRRRIRAAVDSIDRTCGQRPRGWYSRYGPSVHTRKLLVEVGGFLYDSDAYNDDLPYYVDVNGKSHLVLPYSATYNDSRFVSVPRYARAHDFAADCTRAIQYLWQEGEATPRMLSIGLHPRISGDPSRASALEEVIAYAQDLGGIWIARRIDIARHWLAKYPPPPVQASSTRPHIQP